MQTGNVSPEASRPAKPAASETPDHLYHLGLNASGEAEKARIWQQLIDEYPGYANINVAYRGLLDYYATHDVNKGAELAHAVLDDAKLLDQHPSLLLDACEFLFKSSNQKDHRTELAETILAKHYPNHILYVRFGSHMVEEGLPNLALRLYEEAFNAAIPENMPGVAINAYGRPSERDCRLRALLDRAYIALEISKLDVQLGSEAKAIDVLQPIIEAVDETAWPSKLLNEAEEDASEIHLLLGNLFEQQGKKELAREHYLEALIRYRNDAARGTLLEMTPGGPDALRALVLAFNQSAGATSVVSLEEAPANLSLDEAIAAARRRYARSLPEFSFRTLDESSVDRSDFDGRVGVLAFWATWCGPCVKELPEVEKVYQLFKDDPRVRVIAISLDERDGSVRDFLKKRKLTFPVVRSLDAPRLFGLGEIPAIYISDGDGIIQYKHVGYDGSGDLAAGVSEQVRGLLGLLAGSDL